MATRTAYALALAASMWTATASAQGAPDVSGEWVLDRTASVLQAESAAVESATVRIEHRDRRSASRARSSSCKSPSTPRSTSPPAAGSGTHRGGAHVPFAARVAEPFAILTVLIDTPRGEVSNIVRYELLDGGRMLRAIEDVGGAAPTRHNIWIFVRR